MPAVSLKEILQPALEARYGVGAFNIVNDLTMLAVLDAAAETRAPVIIQVSVKTVDTDCVLDTLNVLLKHQSDVLKAETALAATLAPGVR